MEIWLQVDRDGVARLYGRYRGEVETVQATFESPAMATRMFPRVKVKVVL